MSASNSSLQSIEGWSNDVHATCLVASVLSAMDDNDDMTGMTNGDWQHRAVEAEVRQCISTHLMDVICACMHHPGTAIVAVSIIQLVKRLGSVFHDVCSSYYAWKNMTDFSNSQRDESLVKDLDDIRDSGGAWVDTIEMYMLMYALQNNLDAVVVFIEELYRVASSEYHTPHTTTKDALFSVMLQIVVMPRMGNVSAFCRHSVTSRVLFLLGEKDDEEEDEHEEDEHEEDEHEEDEDDAVVADSFFEEGESTTHLSSSSSSSSCLSSSASYANRR